MKLVLEVIGGEATESRVPTLIVVIGEVVADFHPGLTQIAEAATVEQLGFEPTLKRFGMDIIVAVSAAAHTLHSLVTSY